MSFLNLAIGLLLHGFASTGVHQHSGVVVGKQVQIRGYRDGLKLFFDVFGKGVGNDGVDD